MFAMSMIVNLIKLNLFLFICLFISLLFFSRLSCDLSVYVLHMRNHCSPRQANLLTAGSGYCFLYKICDN